MEWPGAVGVDGGVARGCGCRRTIGQATLCVPRLPCCRVGFVMGPACNRGVTQGCECIRVVSVHQCHVLWLKGTCEAVGPTDGP